MWIVGLLVIIAAYEGLKEGYKVLRDDYHKSRDKKVAKGPKGKRKTSSSASHAFGYWLGEGTRGFPQFRHGAARGYHDARTKQHNAQRDRERSAADHAEAHRDASREMYHERSRRNRARRDMRDMTLPAGDDGYPPLRAVDAPDGEDAPVTDGPGTVHEWRDPPMRPGWPQRPDFTPATPPGDAGQNADSNGQPAPKEGTPVPTETTYTQDLAEADKIVSEAEQTLADLKKHQWMERVEQQAAAGLDPDSLSKAADMGDSINDQIKAAEKTVDSAKAFRDSVAGKHQAGHEYHTTAPQGGASREYLSE